MQHILRTPIVVLFFVLFSSGLWALNPPPANDSAWTATNLGMLPIPGPCPGNPYGDTIMFNGSTHWASYNTFDFSPWSCFPNGSPDVWYRFVTTGSNIYIDCSGSNGLDTFFIKVYHSQGSCYSLVPMDCQTSVNGSITATFMTPDVGGEYYIQIGGNNYNKVGDFAIWMKSFNYCDECVKNATIDVSPAPWFGRYGTSQTVRMCATIDRWDYMGSTDLHGIVPRFGTDWDMTTLQPVILPQAASSNGGWGWFTNVSTPDGVTSGFFFDSDSDGDPSDNTGDANMPLTSWTACWEITSLPFCANYDLAVDVYTYCDAQTGTGNPVFACTPTPPMHLSIAGWCCPSPSITVPQNVSCSSAGYITVAGATASSTYNFTVYDTGFAVIGYAPNVTGSYTFTSGIAAGEYLVEAYDQVNSCIAYSTVVIEPAFEVEVVQTSVGCGSGTADAEINVLTGTGPFSFQFMNHPTTLQQDSLATQVADGWLVVKATDGSGCTILDSALIVSEPAPDTYFDYPNQPYCSSTDTIHLLTTPASTGGTFYLLSPSSGVTVDAVNGDIILGTLSTPYWIYVKYSITGICPGSFIDSVEIIAPPQPPVVNGGNIFNYCIGAPAPQITISVNLGETGVWYDNQTTQTSIGTTFTPPLSSTTTPGTYVYGVVSVPIFNAVCTSSPVVFVINANYPPSISVSADTTICLGEKAILTVTPCSSCTYSWNPAPTIGAANTPATSTSPSASTNYSISVTDATTGCISSLQTQVIVNEGGNCVLHVYSGLTPNGDGKNDLWIIDGIDQVSGSVVSIYNRWGKLVWEASGYDNSTVVWEGTDESGNRLPDGTYYYVITASDYKFHGWVELTH